MSKAASPRRKSSATDAWDKQWQERGSKVGTPDGMRKWGQFMMQQGVFAQDEIGFGRVTDSPAEADVGVPRPHLRPFSPPRG